MDFKEYQTLARKTAVYSGAGNNFAYPALGLCGEAGEVAEKSSGWCGTPDRDQRRRDQRNFKGTGRCAVVYFQSGRGGGAGFGYDRLRKYRKTEVAAGERRSSRVRGQQIIINLAEYPDCGPKWKI